MNKYFLYAASVLALASCSSDDFLGENSGNGQNAANSVINFGGGTTKTTRATSNSTYKIGDLQNNGFWVYGTKHSATEDKTANYDQAVYTNYLLAYKEGTANNTQSNTAGWEYVGVNNTPFREHVTPNVDAAQTIKYWDYSAVGYTFYAATANPQNVKEGKVTIDKIKTDEAETGSVYTKGYNVTLHDGADLDQLYFADRKVITKPADTNNPKPDHKNKNVYGGQVEFTFRNALTKVRVAMYEIVPGYSVSIDKFYYTKVGESTQTTVATDRFRADANNTPLVTSAAGVKYKVVYYSDTEANGQLVNQPKMLPNKTGEEGATKTVFEIGDRKTLIGSADNTKSGTKLSTDITKPTYDTDGGKYTLFMPQADNKTTLNLKVDYTLTSLDNSGEQIHVKGATATIPAKYLCWRPNYAYTYIFKISDKTNGSTGDEKDPAGLYPITFDASVVETGDGNAEFISAMGESTITTFAVKDGVYQYGKADYENGSDLYATVVDKDKSTVTLATGNTKVYKLTDTGAAVPNLSEALVANWVANNKTTNYEVVDAANYTFVGSVPSEDGNTITLDPATALKMSGIKAGKYVIEYTGATALPDTYTKVYKIVTVQ